jgi:hypothetical protein
MRIESTHRASPIPIKFDFLKPQPIAASTKAMNARINRMVLKLTGPPHRNQVAVPSHPQADRFACDRQRVVPLP